MAESEEEMQRQRGLGIHDSGTQCSFSTIDAECVRIMVSRAMAYRIGIKALDISRFIILTSGQMLRDSKSYSITNIVSTNERSLLGIKYDQM